MGHTAADMSFVLHHPSSLFRKLSPVARLSDVMRVESRRLLTLHKVSTQEQIAWLACGTPSHFDTLVGGP